MSKTIWGSKTGLWVGSISSKSDGTTITVTLSTQDHGKCIKVHGTSVEIMERVNTILDAFNNEEPTHGTRNEI